MKLCKTFIFSLTALFAISSFNVALAQKKAKPLVIRSLDHDDVDIPEFSARADEESLSGTQQKLKFLRLSTEYETLMDWVDEIQFTYYVLLKAKNPKDVGKGGSEFNMFKGSVTYKHVAKGKHLSGMFMHPSVFRRYGKVEAIGVEVSVGGTMVAQDAAPKKTDWWKDKTALGEPLLKRSETPYSLIEIEKYEMIKK